MSPQLTKEGVPDNKPYKFIRAYDEEGKQHLEYGDIERDHLDISREAKLQRPLDAGFIRQKFGKIVISGDSVTLEIHEEENIRNETARIINELTGNEVITI